MRLTKLTIFLCVVVAFVFIYAAISAAQPTKAERRLMGYWRVFGEGGQPSHDLHMTAQRKVFSRFPGKSNYSDEEMEWKISRENGLMTRREYSLIDRVAKYGDSLFGNRSLGSTWGILIEQVSDDVVLFINREEGAFQMKRIQPTTPPLDMSLLEEEVENNVDGESATGAEVSDVTE